MALTGQQFPIAAGRHTATIVEVGAGLREFHADGREVTVGYPDDVLPPKGCGAVLLPWPNRLRGGRYHFDGRELQVALSEPAAGNANHGLARWSRWAAVRHEPDTITLALDVVPQTGWPFELHAEVTYALDAEAGLTVTLSAENRGRDACPFGAGCHPYLATHGAALGDVRLRVPAAERLLVDAAQIPVGREPLAGTAYELAGAPLGALRLDDGFTGLPPGGTVVLDTNGGRTELWFDDAFGFLQIYTLDALLDGRPGVAVEPMTCAADAFNSGDGLLVLEPGQGWTGRWGIRAS